MKRAFLASLIVTGACGGPDSPDAGTDGEQPGGASVDDWFIEAARERGLVFEHVSGHAERFFFPEIMGGGGALFDADGDGDLDVYLVQSGDLHEQRSANVPNRFFLNDGEGHFRDVTDASGAADRGYGMGAAVGDVDGDGDLDLYVTNVGANTLLANRGNGTFEDVTASAGVGDEGWGTSATFFDADGDGDLDLFCVNYIFWSVEDEVTCEQPPYGPDYCAPRSYDAPAPDRLYLNDGSGVFTDVSETAGLRSAFGNGLGVVAGDFDGDGRTDVFVANDGTPNQLWCNLGGGRFEDRALRAGCAVDENGSPKAGMGVGVRDLDRDGDEDLLVVNLNRQSDSFFRNDGNYFTDRTARARLTTVSRPFTRFGCGFGDFDHDGFDDLYLANGRVARSLDSAEDDPYAEPNLLLRGGPDGFAEVSPRGGLASEPARTSRAALFGDVDGDGALDVIVVDRDAPVRLLLNRRAAEGAWLVLDVRDGNGAPAIGASVTARFGERSLLREVRSASSYLAASDPRMHFGLGAEPGLGAVEVRWPDGSSRSFGDLAAGSIHVLRPAP